MVGRWGSCSGSAEGMNLLQDVQGDSRGSGMFPHEGGIERERIGVASIDIYQNQRVEVQGTNGLIH